jgi:hypothetical protein
MRVRMNIRSLNLVIHKLFRILPICLLFAILIGVYYYSQSRESSLVSIIQLIVLPEKHHNKNIRVVGFLRLEFEGTALYPLKEFDEHGLLYNKIWLDIDRETALRKHDELDSTYALIEGTFNSRLHGHRGLSVGTISKITRMQKWSGLDESFRDLYREHIEQ